MSRVKAIYESRNNKIRESYNKLISEKIGNAQKYTKSAILEMLSSQFYLSPATLKDILDSKNRKTGMLRNNKQ